jgi:hypothetical protein
MEWFLVFSLYRFSVFWASLGVFDSLGLHVLLRKGKFAFVVFDTRVFLSGHGSPISCIGFGLGVYLCGVWVGAYDEEGTVHRVK